MAHFTKPPKAQAANPPASQTPQQDAPAPPRHPLSLAREWADAIIIAYVLAMFIRTFGVELFKIPTGSMTPILIGDYVSEVDYDGDGQRDLLVLKDDPARALAMRQGVFQVYLRAGDKWDYKGEHAFGPSDFTRLEQLARSRFKNPVMKTLASWRGWDRAIQKREDRILVNKFAYWFHPPKRGDLIVFKIPKSIWDETKPTYIKRAVALGGETVSLVPTGAAAGVARGKGRLAIDGKPAADPPVFKDLLYGFRVDSRCNAPENVYEDGPGFERRFVGCKVPEGNFLPFGDNTDHSSDGRFWGTVPYANLRGKAFLRFWPLGKFKFLG